MVGVQTKFNFAWVRKEASPASPPSRVDQPPIYLTQSIRTGSSKIHPSRRPTARRRPPVRDLPHLARAPPRVPLLPGPRQLQAGQLRRGPPLQRPVARQGARQPAGVEPAHADRRQGRAGRADGRCDCQRHRGGGGRYWRGVDAEFGQEEVERGGITELEAAG